MVLEGSDCADHAVVRKDGGVPLPFLYDLGVSLMDQTAQLRNQLSPPVTKVIDLFVNELRCGHLRPVIKATSDAPAEWS